jgi:hypothetical protein
MIIDHIGFAVSDHDRSKRFYAAALAPLGIELILEVEGWSGFGANRKPELWFGPGEAPKSRLHIAFTAARTMDRPGFAKSIIRTITARSSSIPTVTTSKPCATSRSDRSRAHQK